MMTQSFVCVVRFVWDKTLSVRVKALLERWSWLFDLITFGGVLVVDTQRKSGLTPKYLKTRRVKALA